MTTPYETEIEGQKYKVIGMGSADKENQNRLLDGGEKFVFQPFERETFNALKLQNVSKLTFTDGEWLINGAILKSAYMTAEAERRKNSDTRTRGETLFRLLEKLDDVPIKDWSTIKGVAWFEERRDKKDGETVESCEQRREFLLSIGCNVDPIPPLPSAKAFEPVLLTDFCMLTKPSNHLQTEVGPHSTHAPLKPPEINETFLWHVQQQILDKLDIKLRSAPSASQVFICFSRDRLTLAKMHRNNKNWSESTIKLRIKSLRAFLKNEFNSLTLESFFVDRSVFSAAERQLANYRAKNISPLSVGELHNEDGED